MAIIDDLMKGAKQYGLKKDMADAFGKEDNEQDNMSISEPLKPIQKKVKAPIPKEKEGGFTGGKPWPIKAKEGVK